VAEEVYKQSWEQACHALLTCSPSATPTAAPAADRPTKCEVRGGRVRKELAHHAPRIGPDTFFFSEPFTDQSLSDNAPPC